jgi:transposase-like protein
MRPSLNKRCRPHLKPTNRSYRTDETYIKVRGEDKYLYRAVDSSGQTIDFLLTAKRDVAAAKRFFRKALSSLATLCRESLTSTGTGRTRPQWKR